VATGPTADAITALAIGSDSLYFGTSSSSALTGGEIDRVPTTGGPPVALVSNVQPTELLLDGGSLFYVDNIGRGETSSLRVVPTSGGSHLTIASDSLLSNVRVDASYVYYSTSDATGAGRILRVAREPSVSAPELVVETSHPWGFAIDAEAIYWTRYDGGGALLRRPLAGGATTTLAMSNEVITAPTVHGDDVYFFYGGTPGECRGAVLRVPRTGGAVERVSIGGTGTASSFGGLAVDASYLYWSQIWMEDGWLFRAPIAGGGPELLETKQIMSGRVTATASDLFWVARPSPSAPYEVRAVER
jgi:hypothetical protein